MPKLIRKYALLAKVETTYGQDANPQPINVVLVENVRLTPNIDRISRANVALPDLDKLPSLIGRTYWTVSFDCEVRGSGGNATDPPDWAPLVQACSFSQTVGADNVTFAPVSTNQKSVTIYVYLDGLLHKLVGCVGNFTITGEVGQPARFSFEFRGKMSALPSDASNPTVTYQNIKPALCLGAGFEWGSYNLPVARFTLDLNNTLAPRQDLRETYGYLGFFVSDRNPEGGFDPEVQALSTFNAWDDLFNRDAVELEITLGSGAGNQVIIDAPSCRIFNLGYGDRDGILTYDLRFEASRTTGDDSFTIVTK